MEFATHIWEHSTKSSQKSWSIKYFFNPIRKVNYYAKTYFLGHDGEKLRVLNWILFLLTQWTWWNLRVLHCQRHFAAKNVTTFVDEWEWSDKQNNTVNEYLISTELDVSCLQFLLWEELFFSVFIYKVEMLSKWKNCLFCCWSMINSAFQLNLSERSSPSSLAQIKIEKVVKLTFFASSFSNCGGSFSTP